jgi:hypothetical protein
VRPRRGHAGRGSVGPAGLLAAGLLLALAACSSRGAGAAATPDAQLSGALASTDSLDFDATIRTLTSLRRRCGASLVGRRATLLLAAAHLDPRNPEARPGRAADLAGAYLREGGGPAWTRPLAEVLYLEALEKGASAGALDAGGNAGATDAAGGGTENGRPGPGHRAGAAPPDGCGEGGGAPLAGGSALPSLPGSPLAFRLEQLRGRVAELEAELERIRRTLEP